MLLKNNIKFLGSVIGHGKRVFYKRGALPIYLIHFVTERCNARCLHCLGSFTNKKPENELTLEEIEKISASLGPLFFLLPTGGEPFLRKDLPEIIRCYYNNNSLRKIGMPTNGSLTETAVKSVTKILEIGDDLHLGVDISIDAIGEDHDKIRNFPGLFEKATKTYRAFKDIEKDCRNFNTCLEITVSSYNQDKLSEIYDYFLDELGIDNLIVRIVRGTPRDPCAKDVDINKFEAFSQRIEEDILSSTLPGYSNFPMSTFVIARDIIGRRLTMKLLRENRYQIPCYAGNLTGVLRSNGDVYPCELLGEKYGNLRDVNYNFKKLWLSERAEKIRRHISKGKCFCTHECFITNNILFNPRMLPGVMKEWTKLKLRQNNPKSKARQV
jgi:radical SAM protein with 4Fe4S-binding SPASM domain